MAAATGKRPGNIDKALVQAIGSLDGNGVTVDGDFLWTGGERTVPVRRSEEQRRDIDQVCDAELEDLVTHCMPKDGGVDVKEVVTKVANLLGYKRPTLVLRSKVEGMVVRTSDRTLVAEEPVPAKTAGASPSHGADPDGHKEEACP
jgi:hypothetical protein